MAENDDLSGLPGATPGHPHYFREPMLDHLLDVVLRLGAEVWVLRDRQAVIEALLEREGRVTAEMIEQFRPDPAMAEKLRAERQAFLDRVYAAIYAGLGAQDGAVFEASVLGLKKSRAE